jgi:dienelactone hydrolase
MNASMRTHRPDHLGPKARHREATVTRVLAVSIVSLLAQGAAAAMREEQIDVPVRVADIYGKVIEQSIKVTVFRDDANPRPAPVLVLNHGRAIQPEARARMGRVRLLEASRFFVARGFIVAVPTRVGYGVSGGPDVEDTGVCTRKNYPPAYAASAEQALAALAAVRERPDAAKDRAIIMGQSFGGATAVAVASMNPSGVQATINFAGGGGGNPETQPQRPCVPQLLERMFKAYGQTARIPMLWVYAENDMYFGPTLPREWYDAYVSHGAPAEFVLFPPQGDDGHQLFYRFQPVWQPKVAEFLDAVGFKAPTRKTD